ncbi:PaaI family thioesterase [uncultured Ferrimonas sp.]|uniref:PaaI family thioesterase n=1 Tax=uncultured Ferrimonas sp. TaxID=432640 RepID=UPI00260A1CF0|nr:PaaI family thioesterase [uncultured Ferrimonas sp.]
MDFKQKLQQAASSKDFDALLQLVPYVQFIGMECERFGDEMVFRLPPKEENIGNPMLPALHGGVIAGFMEMSAIIQLMVMMQTPRVPKIVDFSVDYLRAGHLRESYCECIITRQGRRVANVNIITWQSNRKQPIATARAHFLLE